MELRATEMWEADSTKGGNGMIDEIFGDLTPFIRKVENGMLPFVEANEAPLGYLVLKDGRKAQITVKLNTCENEWIGD